MPLPTTGTPATRLPAPADALLASLLGGYRWPGNVLTYSFPDAGASWSTHPLSGYGVRGSAAEPWSASFAPLSPGQRMQFQAALQRWSEVADLRFVQVPDDALQAGDLRAALTHLSVLSHAAAWAYYPSPVAAANAGDLWFNALDAGAVRPWTPGGYSFLTLLHEIGHAIGLKHPFDGSPQATAGWNSQSFTVMSYDALDGVARSEFSFYPTTPMLLDIAALQHVYGPNLAHRTGNDAYLFDDATPVHQTLWDAGGTDTLRYDGALPAEIVLLAGQGSTLGQPVLARAAGGAATATPNLWLAHGVQIENATGGSGADRLVGNAAANVLTGRAGNDVIAGGGGVDVAVFRGKADQYTLAWTAGALVVRGPDGEDTLSGIERLQFDDRRIALDVDGHAGQAWRLYQAAFARAPDAGGLGHQISALDRGLTLPEVAQGFLASAEFSTRYGALQDADFVVQLYRNVLQREPDAPGLSFHLDRLASGALGRADVLASFSESPENQAALVGAMAGELPYL